ncbi:MAG: hypothetical protein Q8N84_00425 [bacterium]|nr:hypothetical protein [bacterium]
MPQVFVVIAPEIADSFQGDLGKANLRLIAQTLMRITESELGIALENDVAFTAIPALLTIRDAAFQVEVRFTAGACEYHRDEVFDPPKETLIKLRNSLLEYCLAALKGVSTSVSVWIIPMYRTEFRYALNMTEAE